MKIHGNRITWPRRTRTCVQTWRYGFSGAERNVQPFPPFPLFLYEALAKVNQKLNPDIYYTLVFTALLLESAVFRVAPFFPPPSSGGKKTKNQKSPRTRHEGDRCTWLSRRQKHHAASQLLPRSSSAPGRGPGAAAPPRRSLLGKEQGKRHHI